MENIKFEFYRGRTYIRTFTIKGWSYDIDEVYFTVKEKANNKSFILQKTIGNGILEIENKVENDKVCRTYNLEIKATDTDNFESNKKYDFDIAIISGELKQTVATGTIKLKETSTHTYTWKN